jgi:hypothetical protein
MSISRRALIGGAAAGAGALALSRYGFQNGVFAQAGNVPKLPIGMNLSGIADWEAGFPFRNLMWGARLWMSKNQNMDGPWQTEQTSKIPLDENGYPLEIPFRVAGQEQPQIVFVIVPNVRKAGRYVLLHDGVGEFSGLGATKVLEAAPGRVELEMKHTGTDMLEGFHLLRSQKGNHVRNIRIVPVEDEKVDLAKAPFLPEFLEFVRPFHALRFMDWAVTNASLEEEWSKRKKPGFYTMTGEGGDADNLWGAKPDAAKYLLSGGVALEVILQAANVTGIDPWLCVPHRANDEYIREMAKLVKEQLDPKLKVYVEYSNEVWNWAFMQAQWMIRSKLAGDMVEAAGGKAWEDDAKTKGNNHPERMGALARRTFKHWEDIWTGADRARLIRVVGVQHGWFDTGQRTGEWVMKNGGADALSPAGYVGPSEVEYKMWDARGAALTAEEAIANLDASFEGGAGKWTREYAALAKKLGLKYVVYEGGQHIQPEGQAGNKPYAPALAAAQTNPAMYDLYLKNLRLHQEVGTDLFCAFASIGAQGSRYGSWGHKARYDQPLSEAPKMRALLDANTPRKA